MAPFRYENTNDPRLTGTIAELMLRGPQARAQAAERIAAVQAQGAQQQASAWSGAVGNIGQLIGAIPQQIQQQKRAAQQDQIGALQISEMQAAAGDRNTARAEQERARHDQITTQIGLKLHDSGNTLEAMQEALNSAEKYGLINTDEAQAMGAAVSADPSKIPLVAKGWIGASPQGRAILEKTIEQKPDAQTIRPFDGSVVAPALPSQPKTQAELAADAANPNSPTQARSTTALDLLKPPKAEPTRTAEQDDQRYREILSKKTLKQPITADDAAWATAYEHQKTLTTDTSASAAANRQANAIAAQTAQQGRAQTFAEAQAGRKELTEKVEQPYQTAVASANTMRDVVAAAKAGNKVAASLQSLETTMAAIRAQGLNRINTAEIGSTADAGSLWDRIVGRVGKLASGEPVPADLQKDMTEFASILEKAAYKKYAEAHKSVTTRYGLKDETPLPSPFVRMRAPNGQETDVTPDQVEHYKALGATVVKP